MPVRELREKYNQSTGKTSDVLRRAIRAEIPGGNELLDALTLTSQLRKKSDEYQRLYQLLLRGRDAMMTEIAQRYNFKSLQNENIENEKTN